MKKQLLTVNDLKVDLKRISSYLIILFFICQFSSHVSGQCSGNITLTTQSEVNVFACSNFTGNLTIQDDNNGVDNIVDLTPIFNNVTAGLESVDGDFSVFNCDFLITLEGLQGLSQVTGSLEISFNDILSNASFFPNLQTVGFDLNIFANNAIVSLSTFDNLTSVGNSFSLTGNSLSSIPDYPLLTDVPVQLTLKADQATSLDAFNSLTNVGLLGIGGDNLQTLSGFDNLSSATISLQISDCPLLTTIDAFSSLTSAAQIQYLDNPSLVSVPTFPNLVSLDGYEFANSGDVQDVFPNITSTGYVIIRDSDITIIDDIFPDLENITNFLAIFDNPNLVSVNGFESLTSIASLEVTDNASIDCCDIIPFAAITTGNVLVQSNGGNICSFFNTVLNTAPTLNCPADMTVSATSGQNSADVTISVPSAIYDCDLLSYTVDVVDENNMTVINNMVVSEGANETLTLPEGDNTVTFTAIGNNNLSGNCSFMVTVDAGIPCSGNVILSTQADVNNFSCTVFDGFLTIDDDGTDPITDLTPLTGLTTVNLRFLIRDCASLTTLDGLESLTSIGTNLDIVNSLSLSDFSALDNLQTVAGTMVMNDVGAQDFSFNSLQSVGGILSMISNDDILDISGFNNLTSVGALSIGFNPNQELLSGFQSLQNIDTDLIVTSNNNMTSVSGFGALTNIGGLARVSFNAQLQVYPFWGSNVDIGGDLILRITDVFDISNFASIVSVGGDLVIEDNSNLSLCCIIPDMNIAGNIIINDNAPGCNSIGEIGGDIPVVNCPSDIIVSIDQGPSLDCIGEVSIISPTPVDDCGELLTELALTDPNGNITLFGYTPGQEVTYDVSELGEWTFEFFASDDLEQTGSCTMTVTVEDDTAPEWDDPSGSISLTGICGVDDAQMLADANIPTANDGICGGTTTVVELGSTNSVICGSSEVVTFAYQVSDDAGNVNPVDFTVEVTLEDNEAPILSGMIPDMTINCTDVFPSTPTITANDACQGDLTSDIVEDIVIITGDCSVGGIAETQEITWTVTDACNNTSSESWTVTVINDFVADLGLDQIACAPNGVLLGPIAGGVTYEWSTGETTPTIEAFNTGQYFVTVTSTNGCCSIDDIFVTVESTPDISAQGGVLDCSGNGVQLMGNSSTPDVTYSWTGPGGFNTNIQNPTVFETGDYTLFVTSLSGCESAQTVMVDQDIDVPDIMVTGGIIDCDNVNVTLTGSSTTTGVSYSWTGPDGYTSSDENPTVSNPGDYTLEVEAPNGCISVATTQVLEDTDVPDIMVTGGVIDCQNEDLMLMASSTTADVTYSWTGPDGYTSSQQNPTVTTGGIYIIEVMSTNGCTNMDSITVLVDNDVPDVIVAGGTIDCQNEDLMLMGNSTTMDVTYSWIGPDSYTSSEQNPTVSVGGIYILEVMSPNGCTNMDSVIVMVDIDMPDAMATGGVIDCDNTDVVLMGNSATADVTYSWTGPGGYMSLEQNPTVEEPGAYILEVIATNGCSGIDTTEVTASEDLPNVSATGGSITCLVDEVILTGSSTTPDVTYSWTGPDGFMSAEQNPTVNIPGAYMLEVTSPNSCTAVATTQVIADQDMPVISISEQLYNCDDMSVELIVNSDQEASSIEWTGPMGFSSNEQVITVSELGSYSVRIIGVNGCESAETYELTDIFSYTSDIETTDVIGNVGGTAEIILDGGTGPFTILWDNGDTGNMTEDLTPGTHTVMVTDGLGCEQEFSFEILMSTSTSEIESLSNMKTFPNPVEDEVSITWNNSVFTPATIEVYNVDGKLEKKQRIFNQGLVKLDVAELNSGFYILILRDRDRSVTQRIFKTSI
jgi:hypothetical protein